MKLSEGSIGSKYRITGIEGTYEERSKLNELGCHVNENVEVIRKAGFGTPIIVAVHTYRIIMSLYLTNLIEVEVIHQ